MRMIKSIRLKVKKLASLFQLVELDDFSVKENTPTGLVQAPQSILPQFLST